MEGKNSVIEIVLVLSNGEENRDTHIVKSLLVSLPADSSMVSKHALDLKPPQTKFPYICTVLNYKYIFSY